LGSLSDAKDLVISLIRQNIVHNFTYYIQYRNRASFQ